MSVAIQLPSHHVCPRTFFMDRYIQVKHWPDTRTPSIPITNQMIDLVSVSKRDIPPPVTQKPDFHVLLLTKIVLYIEQFEIYKN